MVKTIEVSDEFYKYITEIDYACKTNDTFCRCDVLMAHYKWFRNDQAVEQE